METLLKALQEFDGKSVTLLTQARKRFASHADFYSQITVFAGHEHANISAAATWLIKDGVLAGEALTSAQTCTLLGGLNKVVSWQAQLHICQAIGFLKIHEDQVGQTLEWLRPLLGSERPFLRAWSMDACQHLAEQHDSCRPFAAKALTGARQDPAASVRARARKWPV